MLRRRHGRRCARHARRGGQALIESCIVILFICLICFGLLQISRFFVAREILDYAAARGARARTVGFNRFMLFKAVRYEYWPDIDFSHRQAGFDQIEFETRQNIPFSFPLHRLYYAADALEIQGGASMENHFPLYLQNLEM